MITKHLGTLTLAVAAALSSGICRADLVTYDASGTITQVDSLGQLPSGLAPAAVGGEFSVMFTVDTNTPGTVFGPGQNLYQSALVSASASLGSGNTGLSIFSNQVAIAADAYDGTNFDTDWLLSANSDTSPSGFTGIGSGFQLFTGASTPGVLGVYADASLSNAPLSAGNANAVDQLSLQFQSFTNGTAGALSDIDVGADVSIKQVSDVTSAPEIDPATGLSALTLLLGSVAIMRRRRIGQAETAR